MRYPRKQSKRPSLLLLHHASFLEQTAVMEANNECKFSAAASLVIVLDFLQLTPHESLAESLAIRFRHICRIWIWKIELKLEDTGTTCYGQLTGEIKFI
jgi:hypothetical protein